MIISWLTENWLELFGTIAALIYLYFSINQKIWLWPLGILTSVVYVYIFFVAKFYADAGLNLYYVVISIYGWYYWTKGVNGKAKLELPVRHITKKESWILSFASIFVFIIIYFILNEYTDSPVPLGDSFTTAFSIIATWMLAKKILEQWLVWIVVNAVSMALYVYKDLNITAGLFVIYTAMAVWGYYQWRKSINHS